MNITNAYNPVKARELDENDGSLSLVDLADPVFATYDDARVWLIDNALKGKIDRKKRYVVVPAWVA